MSGSLAPLMLRIAAAVDGDGGAGVRSALQSVLQDRAPFDGGELVYARIPGEHASFLLGDAREAFLGSDLVEHVLSEGVPFRIDDWRDAAAFPETLSRLRYLGLRSVLVLPFRFAEPEGPRLRGALAVARRHGWAFVGASLHVLAPLAGLAGLAFDQALRLSALAEQAPAFLAPVPPPAAAEPDAAKAPPEPGRAELEEALAEAMAARADEAAVRAEAGAARARAETLSAELETARHDAARATEALREAGEAARALRSSLESAEAAWLEAEHSRDDWAQQAASLRARNESQEAAIHELERGLAGARELEAELQRVSQERDRALREADEQRDPTVTPPAAAGSASEPPTPALGSGRPRSRKGGPA